MSSIEVREAIAAPAGQVWPVLARVEHWPRWLSTVLAAVMI